MSLNTQLVFMYHSFQKRKRQVNFAFLSTSFDIRENTIPSMVQRQGLHSSAHQSKSAAYLLHIWRISGTWRSFYFSFSAAIPSASSGQEPVCPQKPITRHRSKSNECKGIPTLLTTKLVQLHQWEPIHHQILDHSVVLHHVERLASTIQPLKSCWSQWRFGPNTWIQLQSPASSNRFRNSTPCSIFIWKQHLLWKRIFTVLGCYRHLGSFGEILCFGISHSCSCLLHLCAIFSSGAIGTIYRFNKN